MPDTLSRKIYFFIIVTNSIYHQVIIVIPFTRRNQFVNRTERMFPFGLLLLKLEKSISEWRQLLSNIFQI